MAEHKKVDPGATAIASGARTFSEAAKLPESYTPKTNGTTSGSFYWDRQSNSIQPLCDLSARVLA